MWTKIPIIKLNPCQWIQIAGGYSNVCALDALSYAWCWGVGTYGVNGNGSTASASIPQSVLGGKQFKFVASTFGGHNAALDANGYMWTWGDNTYGQLGNNLNATRSSPDSVVGGKQWIHVSCGGSHTVALDTNSYAWVWGRNNYGQLGLNVATTATYSSPTSLGATQYKDATAGHQHTVLINSNGYAWACGYNTYGQIGDYTRTNRSAPTSVLTTKQWSRVIGGYLGTTTLDTQSYPWGWGYHGPYHYGERNFSKSTPVAAPSHIGQVKMVSGGYGHATGGVSSYWIDSNDNLWCMGTNQAGNAANGKVDNVYMGIIGACPVKKFKYVSAYSSASLAIDQSSYLWAWGNGGNGQLGVNSIVGRSSVILTWKHGRPKSIFGLT